jgi:ComF family protein
MLPPVVGGEPAPYFCPDCRKELAYQVLAQCPDCFAAYCDCRCQPTVMHKAGSAALRKLAPYGMENEPRVVERLVHNIKTYPRGRVFRACVEEWASLLAPELEKLQKKSAFSRTVITFLPRSRKKVLRYGFDQARELAMALSQRTGYPMLPLLKRVRDGKAQKSLTVKERRENLRGAFALVGDPTDCCVVLVDDIVTTGAGMAEAVRMLKGAGAVEVLCLSIAVTAKKKPAGRSGSR